MLFTEVRGTSCLSSCWDSAGFPPRSGFPGAGEGKMDSRMSGRPQIYLRADGKAEPGNKDLFILQVRRIIAKGIECLMF